LIKNGFVFEEKNNLGKIRPFFSPGKWVRTRKQFINYGPACCLIKFFFSLKPLVALKAIGAVLDNRWKISEK
jgi:hypothetical protein